MPTRIGGSRRNSYFSSAASASIVDESSTSLSAISNGIVDGDPLLLPDIEAPGNFEESVKSSKFQEVGLSSTSNTTRNTDFVGGSNSQAEELSTDTKEERTNKVDYKSLSDDTSLDFSVPRPDEEVSWSESEGSTYITELDAENAPLILDASKENLLQENSEKEEQISEDDSALFDVPLDDEGPTYMSSTTEDNSNVPERTTIDGPVKTKPSATSICESKAGVQKAISKPDEQRVTDTISETSATADQRSKESSSKSPSLENQVSEKQKGTRRNTAKKGYPPPRPKSCCLSYSESANTQNDPFYLEHVDYYSDVDTASRNDDVSEVCFISKEATSSIFCRRMIPLEIPVKKVEDDVSAVSTINDASVMPSVMGGDNSVNAVRNARQPVAEKEEATKKETEKTRLDNVDYLSFVEVASSGQNQDISTVGYKLPYNIAHVAFDKTLKVPTTVPIRNDQDDVSTIYGSVTPKTNYFAVIQIPEKHCTVSSLDSASFESIHSADNDLYGDDGSDNAVRPARETTKNTKNKKCSSKKAGYDKKKEQKATKTNPQESQKRRRHKASTRHHRKGEKRSSKVEKKTETAHSSSENKDSTQADAKESQQNTDQTQPKSRKSLHSDKETSTDVRIRELKSKIRAMQESSSLGERSGQDTDNEKEELTPEHHGSSKKKGPSTQGDSNHIDQGQDVTKPDTSESEVKPTSGRGVNPSRTGSGTSYGEKQQANDRGTVKEKDNVEEKECDTNEKQRPDHDARRKEDMQDRLQLYDVDYLDTVDVASHDHDISTVDVRFSPEVAKAAFVRICSSVFGKSNDSSVPSEIPLEVETVHASSHGNDDDDDDSVLDDMEAGIRRKKQGNNNEFSQIQFLNTRRLGKNDPAPISSAEEPRDTVSYYLNGAKTRTVAFGRETKEFMLDLWQRHMEGRSTNEKIVIAIIGLSFFVLLVLLVVAIAKR